MVVVAVQTKLAGASSYGGLVNCVPVEVMRLGVREGRDALLGGGGRSVVCHFCRFEA